MANPPQTITSSVLLRNFEKGPFYGPAFMWALAVGSIVVLVGSIAYLSMNEPVEGDI